MILSDILFPTDFSEAAEDAGRVAREMARQWGVTLHVVHVVPPVTDPGDVAERLARLAAKLADGLRLETAILSGRVAQHIVRYARDKHIALIVLGTHGRTGLSRALLGSVAESVVRLAPCPVLTVPATTAKAVPVASPMIAVSRGCVVCGGATDDLICQTCRTRIRGEALEQKLEAERAGHRGSPV